MKTLLHSCASLCCLSLLLSSCNTFYFSEPQPVDVKNIYKFPKQMRGTWLTGSDTLRFEANKVIVTQTERIFDGVISSNPVDTLEKAGNLKPLKSLKMRMWSSEKKDYDTVSNYIIRGNKIYKVQWDNIAKGASYKRIKDSIEILTRIELPLGDGTFLRKINDTTYVGNIKVTNTMEESDGNGPWWTVVLIEVPSADRMYVSYPEQGLKKDPGIIGLKGNAYYLDSRWTAAQMLTQRAFHFEKRDEGYRKVPR